MAAGVGLGDASFAVVEDGACALVCASDKETDDGVCCAEPADASNSMAVSARICASLVWRGSKNTAGLVTARRLQSELVIENRSCRMLVSRLKAFALHSGS